MVDCRNDITHRTRKLGTSFLVSEIYSQKTEISHFERHKSESAYVHAHYWLVLWQKFSENHVKYVRVPTGVPSICACCCFAYTGCFSCEKH